MNEKRTYLPKHPLERQDIDQQDRFSVLTTPDLFGYQQQFSFNRDILPVASTVSRKRSIQDDYSIEDSVAQTNKRVRCEPELENQPPRARIKRRSLFLYHPKQDLPNRPMHNDLPSSFNQFSPPVSTYPPFQSDYTVNPYSPRDFYTDHLINQNFYAFGNDSFEMCDPCLKSSINPVKTNLHFLSSPSNMAGPLRTTSFVLDSKQQTISATIMRTGNISPAHSDTSTESTSTCSSDEQQFRLSFHYQPSRSNRERENYEQLLDLAEKLADPNRLEKVDLEQFFSYRYKTTATSTDIFLSKQTACVICMSPFKNGQRIRVLPCQHEYHTKCIARWFTMNSSCPICRRDNFLSTC